ncbi:COP9 signalosome complex subunit 3 [Lucilia cuprina]|uniref:COP9 signalosome complex subunit 3 n=1 Tax=Lucilia cuprina TaxID=7375 RepID=A0A0L0CL66_LUCCU|nr:COP9 signalosome complex subunit 3 [Lucilia cuprina]KAI8126188.1 COP9 signalosome complex subunit 3 [Lucilia cuprina]KNC33103.1 COP9 signalosome complex subunit 3 [Lucilia cuprina]
MASALENFVNSVRSRTSSGALEELATHLLDSVEILTKNWNILDNVLETLDMQQHSLGVLYVLIAKFNSIGNSNADVDVLFKTFKKFIEQCNTYQVGLAAHAYYELCHLFTNTMVTQPSCIHGLNVLATAINKIRTSESQLTPIHADLCQLSLKSKCFRVALKYLDVDITTISTSAETRGQNQTDVTNHDAKYFLLYYYYGGMIYTAIKNYERALYFFEVCISTPAMAMSYIMLEAYKKFILVSLILHGKIIPIPKYSSQVISRFMKPIAQVYHTLAVAYATTSSEEVRNCIIKYSETFERDNNMGLVKQVATSLYKKNIQRLTKTFLTLSLSDVASRVQLPSAAAAEKYILNMIKSGEIYATINQKDGMVVFKDDPEKYNSPEMFLKIQQDMDNVMALVKQLNKMEEEIILNPMYIKKAVGNQDDDLASQHAKAFAGDPID